MDTKMIAVDLDGTLLRDDKTVSEEAISVLRKCHDSGLKLVYATARGQSAPTLVPPDLFDGYVQMNGAIAYASDSLIHHKVISTVYARELLLAADDARIDIAVEQCGRTFSNFPFPDEWDNLFLTGYEITDFKELDIEVEKIWAMPKSEPEIELLKKHLQKGLYLVTTRDENFTLIMHDEASKSSAIDALAGHWGIDCDEIVAFGDDVIDIDMLQHCGVGVAMGNAVDEVKAVADYVCDTNENDGIAKWLEEYVL